MNDRINKRTTIGNIMDIQEIAKHIYSEREIKEFDIKEAINDHPLAHKPTAVRSKLAYKEVMSNIPTSDNYILPGQISLFEYAHPKYETELEYYDQTPLILSFGLFRTEENTIREIGLNLHYYPPYTRMRVLIQVLKMFRQYFESQFNEEQHKPNRYMDYQRLRHMLRQNLKIAFGVKEYIPALRGRTWIVPTRLLSTAFYTEGHFSKATLAQIFTFWRQFQ